jgi:putative membrane protein
MEAAPGDVPRRRGLNASHRYRLIDTEIPPELFYPVGRMPQLVTELPKNWDQLNGAGVGNARTAMTDLLKGEQADVQLPIGTKLAFERTYLAHERTQMAWVRTCLALITFGFAIAKFFQYVHEKQPEEAPLLSPKTVGALMISIGLVALALASLQHRRALRALRAHCASLPISLAGVTATLIALLGILALVGALLR